MNRSGVVVLAVIFICLFEAAAAYIIADKVIAHKTQTIHALPPTG